MSIFVSLFLFASLLLLALFAFGFDAMFLHDFFHVLHVLFLRYFKWVWKELHYIFMGVLLSPVGCAIAVVVSYLGVQTYPRMSKTL